MRRESRALSRVGRSRIFVSDYINNSEEMQIPLAASCFTKGVSWISVAIFDSLINSYGGVLIDSIRFDFRIYSAEISVARAHEAASF